MNPAHNWTTFRENAARQRAEWRSRRRVNLESRAATVGVTFHYTHAGSVALCRLASASEGSQGAAILWNLSTGRIREAGPLARWSDGRINDVSGIAEELRKMGPYR